MEFSYLIDDALKDNIQRLNVAVVILNNENKILICQRSHDKLFLPNVWHIPGGKVENNESIEEASKREIKEELSLDLVDIIYYTGLNHDYLGHGNQKSRTLFFLAKAQGEIKLDFENQAYKFIDTREIDNYFLEDVRELNHNIFQSVYKLISQIGDQKTISNF